MRRSDDERPSLALRIECALIAAILLFQVASCTVNTVGGIIPAWLSRFMEKIIQSLF
jgi:hypothetical protein